MSDLRVACWAKQSTLRARMMAQVAVHRLGDRADTKSVSIQTPATEPHSEPTVPCDSCGRDTPTPAGGGVTVPRARCSDCEIAVAQALDEVMRQLVGPRTDADALPSMPRGPMSCFDCGSPGVEDQEASPA